MNVSTPGGSRPADNASARPVLPGGPPAPLPPLVAGDTAERLGALLSELVVEEQAFECFRRKHLSPMVAADARLHEALSTPAADEGVLTDAQIIVHDHHMARQALRRMDEMVMARLEVSVTLAKLADAQLDGLWEDFPGMIGDAEDSLIGPIEKALLAYMEWMKKLSEVMALVADRTWTDGDGKIQIDNAGLQALLDFAKLGGPFDGIEMTEAEAKRLIADLGLPGLTLKPLGDGKFTVGMDTAQIVAVLTLACVDHTDPEKDGVRETKMSNAEYQAYVNARDGMMEQFQHNASVMADYLSRQNQKFNDLTKALANFLQQVTQMLMGFINGTAP